MKTKHIIAIGLLSALAVGILGIAIHTGKAKAKTLQTKAENNTEIIWTSNQTLLYYQYNFNNVIPNTFQNEEYIIKTGYLRIYPNKEFDINITELTYKTQNINIPITVTNNTMKSHFSLNIQGNLTINCYTVENNFSNITYDNSQNTLTYTLTVNMLNTSTPITKQIEFNPTFNIQAITNQATYVGTGQNTVYFKEVFTVAQENYVNGNTAGYNTGYTAGETAGYNTGYTAGETAGYQEGETAGYNTGYTAGETAGYNTGYTAGQTAGYQEGETAGYNTGYTAGETAGYNEGLTEGTATGYQNGYDAGYGIGYNDSEAFNHPIALQPLMLNILTMPFTFISQAFDVTLWPGTAYEFNFANFIKGIIAIATIMFIIKLFTSGFSIIGNYTSNIRNESNMRYAQRQKNRASKIHKPSKEKKE